MSKKKKGDKIGPVYLLDGACPACYAGIHGDCYHLSNGACCCPAKRVEGREGDDIDNAESPIDVVAAIKAASEVTDVQSTGRKRAAKAYPITEGMKCEWAELKLAGGGVQPIIGCPGNVATDRHHGPDKNTLNNTEGNVHRICAICHNRWHTANDPFYGERPSGSEPFIPLDGNDWTAHNPTDKATTEEIMQNELTWRKRKKTIKKAEVD